MLLVKFLLFVGVPLIVYLCAGRTAKPQNAQPQNTQPQVHPHQQLRTQEPTNQTAKQQNSQTDTQEALFLDDSNLASGEFNINDIINSSRRR